MNLKNYTSQVPADKSISRIERLLVSAGANNILKNYRDRILESISFTMDINGNSIPFRLPAKVEAVNKVLWAEVKRPQPGTRERIREQAERTAWKIVCDWVEVQISMIQLEQAEFIEVFLPYVYHLESGKTFFERIKGNNFKQLQA